MLTKLRLALAARLRSFRYVAEALRLFFYGEITAQTLGYALRERPPAVCGRRCAWVLDDL